MEVRRHLLLGSVKVNSDWAVLFTDFVNLFTLFVLIFCATTTYLIRSFCKATTYIDSCISTLIISVITLLFILFFLESSVLEPSFLTTSNLFFAQSLAVIRELGLDTSKINVNGGAIALGHPLGCSGAKLSVQLLNEMQRQNKKYGMVSACIGGGQGIAGIYELLK
jgi:hypothetical protein